MKFRDDAPLDPSQVEDHRTPQPGDIIRWKAHTGPWRRGVLVSGHGSSEEVAAACTVGWDGITYSLTRAGGDEWGRLGAGPAGPLT